MNILILDGLRHKDKEFQALTHQIQGTFDHYDLEYEVIQLRHKDIKNCIGCFGCWIKNPGLCILDDEANTIAKKFIQCDVVFWISPILFGGYSYELKKILDRMIGTVLPFFKTIRGEIHHKLRYKSYPKHIYIGLQKKEDTEEQEIFKHLINRNRLNLHDTEYELAIFTQSSDKKQVTNWTSNVIRKLQGN